MGQAMAREALVLEELARAKINLTLRVLGLRADGFHELDSMVAFGDVGDVVRLVPGEKVRVGVTGPFAGDIVGENLAARALTLLAEAEPRLVLGLVEIEKRLPVAAGLGGGSADAAAVLRLVKRANPELADGVDWEGVAAALGSDVPVCLRSRSCRMQGRGERLSDLPYDIDVPALLVNARGAVPADKTARMFRALGAAEIGEVKDAGVGHFAGGRNDLEPVAAAVLPDVADVLAALKGMEETRWARMSGAGPTCFGVYDSVALARAAGEALAAAEPAWWVMPARLA